METPVAHVKDKRATMAKMMMIREVIAQKAMKKL